MSRSRTQSLQTASPAMFQFKRLLFTVAIFLFVGCPDYSHLRDAPDYKNMTDSVGESE